MSAARANVAAKFVWTRKTGKLSAVLASLNVALLMRNHLIFVITVFFHILSYSAVFRTVFVFKNEISF